MDKSATLLSDGGLSSIDVEQMLLEPFDQQCDVPFSLALQAVLFSEGSSLTDAGTQILSAVRMFSAVSKTTFRGRWTPLEIVGYGGSGIVVHANDRQLKQHVALKIVLPSQGRRFGTHEQQRLKREELAMKRVSQHPGIVNFYESHYDDSKSIYFMVIEYIFGRPLSIVAQEHGPLQQDRLLKLGIALVDALQAMHSKNIMHLDVKPDNIMCTEGEDGTWHIKLVDFGLARAPSQTAKNAVVDVTTMLGMTTKNHSIAGTIMFMSPEQFENTHLDFRSDIFSAGITLYHLACRRFPHRRACNSAADALLELRAWASAPPPTLNQQTASVSADFAFIISRAISFNPRERFQTTGEMRAALEKLRVPRTVFISWRMGECKKEVKVLQPALQALGIKVIVVGELPGGDLLHAVQAGMSEAHLHIIMGTATYGKKTSGKIDTWVEMQEIKNSGKPFFLINMNPGDSLMRFQEKKANELFDLDTTAWHRWEVGKKMDPKLPGLVLQKLDQLAHEQLQADKEQLQQADWRHVVPDRTQQVGPAASSSDGDDQQPQTDHIEEYEDPSTGTPYFYNTKTEQSGWTREEVVDARDRAQSERLPERAVL
jgi:tRNA A-37 threonylcarbamoyl transferase component Bud32